MKSRVTASATVAELRALLPKCKLTPFPRNRVPRRTILTADTRSRRPARAAERRVPTEPDSLFTPLLTPTYVTAPDRFILITDLPYLIEEFRIIFLL